MEFNEGINKPEDKKSNLVKKLSKVAAPLAFLTAVLTGDNSQPIQQSNSQHENSNQGPTISIDKDARGNNTVNITYPLSDTLHTTGITIPSDKHPVIEPPFTSELDLEPQVGPPPTPEEEK